jgi:DNA-binding FadR family transcriptional regulator
LQHLTLEHHSQIVNAIRKGKPDKARAAMETHLKEVVRSAK